LGLFLISGLDAATYQWSKIPYLIKSPGIAVIVTSFFLILPSRSKDRKNDETKRMSWKILCKVEYLKIIIHKNKI